MPKKLTMNMVALGNLRHRKKQYLALIVGLILAMTFCCGVPFFADCIRSAMAEASDRAAGRQEGIFLDVRQEDMERLQNDGSVSGKTGWIHVPGFVWTDEPDRGVPLGWLDETAEDLYYLQLRQGRMPEHPSEIALEYNAILRMYPEAEIGDKLTFHTRINDGEDYLPGEKEMTFTLVGVVENRRSYFTYSWAGDWKLHLLPGGYLAPGTDLGGSDGLTALAEQVSDGYGTGLMFLETRNNIVGDNALVSGGGLWGFLTGLMGFLGCFAIANLFAGNFRERKQQIGMLKALGATRRQIVLLFGREAFFLAIFCAPVSIGLAWLGVWIYTRTMGASFLPKPRILLEGGLFSLVCVMLAAGLPLVGMSGLSPMHAIRDTEKMRKMKHKRIHSRKMFRPARLLAGRKLLFSRARQAVCCLLLGVTILGCSALGTVFLTGGKAEGMDGSYEVSLHSLAGDGNDFVNKQSLNDRIPESQRQQVLSLPGVAWVEGRKDCNVNLLLEEVPRYLSLLEYYQSANSSRYSTGNVWFGDQPLTKDNYRELLEGTPNPVYLDVREQAGYTGEAVNTRFKTVNPDQLERLEPYVRAGRIDKEKLDSGEEILLLCPENVGFLSTDCPDRPIFGLVDLAEEGAEKYVPYVLESAECPFRPGDKLTLSVLTEDLEGNLHRSDRETRVGALVSVQDPLSMFALATMVPGMDFIQPELGYTQLSLETVSPLDERGDIQMVDTLRTLFPDLRISSGMQLARRMEEEHRSQVIALVSTILVLAMVCISILNNGISAQLHQDRRSIGTLRAVGAGAGEIRKCYSVQILLTAGIGWGLGFLLSLGYGFFEKWLLQREQLHIPVGLGLAVAGALVLAGFVNLRIQVNKALRQSVVENIREL